MASFSYFANHNWTRSGGPEGSDLRVREDEDLKHHPELMTATKYVHPLFTTYQAALDIIAIIFTEYPYIIAATLLERPHDGIKTAIFAVHFRRAPDGQTSQEFREGIKENRCGTPNWTKRGERVRVDLFINNTLE
jgi:hypothetical protein|tara:strand:- start:1014 stop:1418 length:405 start_codon:yes stop_codon:yes gene_type:complete